MCRMCDEGRPQDHSVSAGSSRRDFLKVSAATGAVAAAGLSLFDPPPAAAQNAAPPPTPAAAADAMSSRAEADIILLDAEAINVAPLNVVPGAVVSLMERSNVETVIVAGKVLKWRGRLLNVNLRKLREELEASRDDIFQAAGVPQNLFRLN